MDSDYVVREISPEIKSFEIIWTAGNINDAYVLIKYVDLSCLLLLVVKGSGIEII